MPDKNSTPCRLETTTGCTTCGIAPKTYHVTIDGVTNDVCTSCTSWNRPYTLAYVSGCTWEESVSLGCGVSLARVTISADDMHFSLSAPKMIRVQWSKGAKVNCLVDNELPTKTVDNVGTDCGGVPGSVKVTVQPV